MSDRRGFFPLAQSLERERSVSTKLEAAVCKLYIIRPGLENEMIDADSPIERKKELVIGHSVGDCSSD